MKKTIIGTMMLILVLTLASVSVSAYKYGAEVKILHASPDAPNVDIWVEGDKAISDLAFNEFTESIMLPGARYNVQVVPAGLTTPVVIDADLNLKNRKIYTVAAINFLDSIEPFIIEDTDRRVPANSAQVRFVHLSPDAPNVDIAVQGGGLLFRDTEFKEVENYKRVSGGEYTLDVRVAGTETVALSVPVEIENGKAYTVFATGSLEDGTLGAALTVDRESRLKKVLENRYSK